MKPDLKLTDAYTTRDFLTQLSDFQALSPEWDKWTTEGQASNEPRGIRFARLSAYVKALGYECHLSCFVLGGFESSLPQHYMKNRERAIIYRTRYDFFLQLQRIRGYKGSWMEATKAITESFKVLDAVVASLKGPAFDELENELALSINPEGKEFTVADLVPFGYVIKDLLDVDSANW
jgi:hypothetical protein